MKIFHFEVTPKDQSWLALPNVETHYSDQVLSEETASHAHDAEVVTVFVGSRVDQVAFDKMPDLKLLITRSTGFDHIDLTYAQSKGVTVCNVPAYGSRTVAEFALALMISLSRKLLHASNQVRLDNDWDFNEFEGFNLQGKTLGLIGTGRIGINMAQIANGLDMKVVAFDAYPKPENADKYNFTYAASLEDVLKVSDVVTLHVPATPDTKHMINLDNITKFKKGALLINTSRGDVVDPEAILKGLQDGYLGGAGLDVLEGEHELQDESQLMSDKKLTYEMLKTLLEGHILLDHPKVIITPHMAFNTKEAKQEIMSTTLSNITNFIDGQPQNVVS